MAACLCLVCIIAILFIKTEQPTDTDFSEALNIVINDTRSVLVIWRSN